MRRHLPPGAPSTGLDEAERGGSCGAVAGILGAPGVGTALGAAGRWVTLRWAAAGPALARRRAEPRWHGSDRKSVV
jgi:hypothetical protein